MNILGFFKVKGLKLPLDVEGAISNTRALVVWRWYPIHWKWSSALHPRPSRRMPQSGLRSRGLGFGLRVWGIFWSLILRAG